MRAGFIDDYLVNVNLREFVWLCTCLGWSQHKSQADTRVIDSLPAPDDNEISKIRIANQWRNPFVLVNGDGYELILHSQPRVQKRLILDELEQTLLRLPRQRWPLGRVVAVQESGLRRPGDDPKIAANLKALMRMLKSHKVRADQWPTG